MKTHAEKPKRVNVLSYGPMDKGLLRQLRDDYGAVARSWVKDKNPDGLQVTTFEVPRQKTAGFKLTVMDECFNIADDGCSGVYVSDQPINPQDCRESLRETPFRLLR